jgi:hypothetical protein
MATEPVQTTLSARLQWSLAKAAATHVCSSLLFSLTNGFNKLQEIFFMKQHNVVDHRKDRVCNVLHMWDCGFVFIFLHASQMDAGHPLVFLDTCYSVKHLTTRNY